MKLAHKNVGAQVSVGVCAYTSQHMAMVKSISLSIHPIIHLIYNLDIHLSFSTSEIGRALSHCVGLGDQGKHKQALADATVLTFVSLKFNLREHSL